MLPATITRRRFDFRFWILDFGFEPANPAASLLAGLIERAAWRVWLARFWILDFGFWI
jgi:hypothetical protein